MKSKRGFTLIELIVVVTIIAVLTVVGITSYSGTNKRARDSRRMADLEKVRVALEMYRQGVGSTYPFNINSLVSNNYMQSIPTGPKGSVDTYKYGWPSGGVGYTYYICAFVEDVGSTTSDVSNCTGLPAGYVGYYKVVNP